jgi:3-hydroxymyristoyl/3-hydroxydecanoyl-(acyl carrier protein) dehydratase
MNQVAENAFISSISHGAAELRFNAAAQPTQRTALIFKMLAEKLLTTHAAQQAIQRDNLMQTRVANGKIRDPY